MSVVYSEMRGTLKRKQAVIATYARSRCPTFSYCRPDGEENGVMGHRLSAVIKNEAISNRHACLPLLHSILIQVNSWLDSFCLFGQYCINKELTFFFHQLYSFHFTTSFFLWQIKQLCKKTIILPVCFISAAMATQKPAVNFTGLQNKYHKDCKLINYQIRFNMIVTLSVQISIIYPFIYLQPRIAC